MPFVVRGDASLLETKQTTSTSFPCFPGRSHSHRGIFASIGAGLLNAGALQTQPLAESRTGVVFPGEFCYLDKEECPRIAGAGARSKRLLGMKNIDVYAVALYVDPNEARALLGHKCQGFSREQLAKEQQLFDDLVAAQDVEKTVKLVITCGLVKRQNFLDALAERLQPPLQQTGDLASLNQFKSFFDTVQFRKGLPLSFTSTKEGLVTQIDGKEVGVITSKKFVHAFLDIYIGKNPVSLTAKENIGRGLADMLC